MIARGNTFFIVGLTIDEITADSITEDGDPAKLREWLRDHIDKSEIVLSSVQRVIVAEAKTKITKIGEKE